MTQIPLHKDRGLDPHLTYCQRCGGDAEELTVGALYRGETREGKWAYFNRGRRRETEKAIGESLYNVTEVPEGERVPATQPCNKCRDELNEWDNYIRTEGAIFFKCGECHREGIIRPLSDGAKELCSKVRRQLKVSDFEPCGVELQRCIEHGG